MIEIFLEPFAYEYMTRAIWVCAAVGGTCAFLSSYLMLKGWSLMGDALAHSVVPGTALAYILALPYAAGAFISGLLAALSMVIVKQKTKLREDTVIGFVFTSFFAAGLLIASANPISVNLQGIIFGNILSISDADTLQVAIICTVSIAILLIKWKSLMIAFFDEGLAQSLGMRVNALNILFFTLLSACTVAALQTVGACLVIAMVVTPGATAYLLTDKFHRLIMLSVIIGTLCSALGAYISYFFNVSPGGLIVSLQTLIFLGVFCTAPKYGLFSKRPV